MRVREVLETCVYAHDLEAAERFYREVMGMEPISRVEGRHVFFRCGHGVFLVFDPDATRGGGPLPPHGVRGSSHVAFAVRGHELDGWRAQLAEHGVEVEREHEWPGGGRSLYFRDPAGNSVELTTPRIWSIDEDEALDG